LCTLFGPETGFFEQITLFDAAGHKSNTISVAVSRPPGFPQLTRPDSGEP
jgi:hypothetical protein